ncbi:MAG TPA: hypothetical protein VKX46_13165, partial [Ktedonobacteraceae bacterium]|nr:hypothetical protein [Ktedonobacteraceae bacterium]
MCIRHRSVAVAQLIPPALTRARLLASRLPRLTRVFPLNLSIQKQSAADYSEPGVWRRTPIGLITLPIQHEQADEQHGLDDHHVENQATWHKVVETPHSHPPVTSPPRPPRPPQSLPVLRLIPFWRYRPTPVWFFWVSIVVLILIVGSGLTGLANTMGRSLLHLPPDGSLSLQVTPHSAAIGAIITIRGSNFSPNGHIGLTRDASIPIVDTGGATIIKAGSEGKFTDTVTIDAEWGMGTHTLTAEDAIMHKTVSYPIIVTGGGGPLRPAHLRLSTNDLDLGSGDQATNTTRTVMLTNNGDGQIAWGGTTTQPWLLMSPDRGTISNAT